MIKLFKCTCAYDSIDIESSIGFTNTEVLVLSDSFAGAELSVLKYFKGRGYEAHIKYIKIKASEDEVCTGLLIV